MLQFCESDADEQLIVRIPFTGSVKLRSILLKTEPGQASPRTMRVFANQRLDFDDAENAKPTLEIELVQPTDTSSREPVEYAVRAAKFPAVRVLTLYFPDNHGADSTRSVSLPASWCALASRALCREAVHEPLRGC